MLDQLGANPIEKITRTTGYWTLTLLLVTLSVTPLRCVSGWPGIVKDIAQRPYITVGFTAILLLIPPGGHLDRRHDPSSRRETLAAAAPPDLCDRRRAFLVAGQERYRCAGRRCRDSGRTAGVSGNCRGVEAELRSKSGDERKIADHRRIEYQSESAASIGFERKHPPRDFAVAYSPLLSNLSVSGFFLRPGFFFA
ncbi:hypothetical protein ACWJKU_17050 [Methylocaldum sp. MU1018]